MGLRSWLDRYYSLDTPLQNELNEALWEVMPWNWEGEGGVHLDDLGDGQAWLESHLPEPPAVLLLNTECDPSGELANDYRAELHSEGMPSPSEADDSGKLEGLDDLAIHQQGFRAFFAAWRNNALPIFERYLPTP